MGPREIHQPWMSQRNKLVRFTCTAVVCTFALALAQADCITNTGSVLVPITENPHLPIKVGFEIPRFDPTLGNLNNVSLTVSG